MIKEFQEDDAALNRRPGRAHHKKQLPVYCHCGRCMGLVLQIQRVVVDHRTRYPRLHDADPNAHEYEEMPLIARASHSPQRIKSPVNDMEESSRASSPRSLVQPGSPDQNDIAHGEPEDNAHPLIPRHVDTPPASPPNHQLIDEQDQVNAYNDINHHDGFPHANMDINEDQDYPFDRLLDDQPHEHHELHYLLGIDIPEQAEIDFDGALYDANLGLPEGDQDRDEAIIPEFQFHLDEEEFDQVPDENAHEEVQAGFGAPCAAFEEHELIRNAYIDAFIQKSVYGATHRSIKHQLKSARRSLSANPNVGAEAIAKMAQTIGTVENRLGVNTDDIITTFTICPLCRHRYSPEYIARADENTCLKDGCEGVLFNLRNLASGGQRRVSSMTYPFASPIAWLRRMLCLPGMAELIQNWRSHQLGDWELSSPLPSEEWMRTLDVDRPIGNLCGGWGWRSTTAGLVRHEVAIGHFADQSPVDPPIRFVSLPFGISFSLNTDWFNATKEGNYSVGACYLAINNLPRHLRFLRENISLCLIMPGPNEPDDYGLAQALEPLVDELLQLKQGVRMLVRRGDPPVYSEELVHGELSQQIADLMARIKMGGGAGLKSELNFCLYCHSRLSSLSMDVGYMRAIFAFRSPQEELNNVHRWRSLPTPEARKQLFEQTGIRFTELHRLPGWYTATSSPLDAMHLIYLGAMDWIVKQILTGPGMFNKRHPEDDDPQDVFNDCLDSMWLPKNYQRLPPKIGQTRTSTKADQWKLTSRILYIPLFLAFRTGDEIGGGQVPRGNRSSTGAKHQAYRAKLLHGQKQKHYRSIGEPEHCPTLEECYPSRALRFHYRQVLRFCLAVNTIDKRSITPGEIAFAQRLLESLCIDYVNNNVQLSPTFHYMMHLEESILKTGSIYNTHVWGMERANGILSRIKHNGKTKGVLEGTMMRGWWNHATIQTLIDLMRSLPNPTEADESVIEDLIGALQGGAEQAQQRGTLMAYIAQCQSAYTRHYGIQDPIKLSSQSRSLDLDKTGIYDLVLNFCIALWPDAGIFGEGMVLGHYLAPVGMVRNHSFVEYNGIRYGAYNHASGKGYCYAYIDERYPVRIERILHIRIPGDPDLEHVCAVVGPFERPQVRPDFPWDAWAQNLGTSSWEYGVLGNLVIVSVTHLSGVFALFDIPMSYGRYWVTVALDSVGQEDYANNDE